MSKHSKERIKVSFCPKCKSYNVRYIFGVRNLFGTIPRMKCRECGLESAIFPILSVTKKDLAKLKKKNERKNN